MWQTYALEDVCTISNGGTPKSKVTAYWGDELQWLTPKDMGKLEERYVERTERQITKQGLDNSSAKLIPANSVILSCRAPIGHVAINTVPMTFNQGCKGLVPKDKLLTSYLYYFLISSKQLLNELGTGTTFKEISAKRLAEVQIKLPPLSEQQRIVDKLDAAFAEIASLADSTQSARDSLGAVREHWLDELFEKCFADNGRCKLGDRAELISGQHIEAKKYNSEGLGIGYLTGPADFGKTNPIFTKYTEFPKKTALRGDILITLKGSGIGKVNILKHKEVAISRQLGAIRSVELMPEFIFCFLSTRFRYYQKLGNGAAIPGITREDVLETSIPNIPLDEQEQLLSIVGGIENQFSLLSSMYCKKSNELANLKSAILAQELQSEAV